MFNFGQFCLAECVKIYQPLPTVAASKIVECVSRNCPVGDGCGWIDLPEHPTGSQIVSEADREYVLRKEADREGKCLREGTHHAGERA
jgi:hypothetical protein